MGTSLSLTCASDASKVSSLSSCVLAMPTIFLHTGLAIFSTAAIRHSPVFFRLLVPGSSGNESAHSDAPSVSHDRVMAEPLRYWNSAILVERATWV